MVSPVLLRVSARSTYAVKAASVPGGRALAHEVGPGGPSTAARGATQTIAVRPVAQEQPQARSADRLVLGVAPNPAPRPVPARCMRAAHLDRGGLGRGGWHDLEQPHRGPVEGGRPRCLGAGQSAARPRSLHRATHPSARDRSTMVSVTMRATWPEISVPALGGRGTGLPSAPEPSQPVVPRATRRGRARRNARGRPSSPSAIGDRQIVARANDEDRGHGESGRV